MRKEPGICTDLEAETERLLNGRARDITLSRPLLRLYLEKSWPQRSKIVRGWAVWTSIVGLLFLPLAYVSVPSAFWVAVFACAVVNLIANAWVFLVWRKPRGPSVEGLSIVVLLAVTMLAFGSIGAVEGTDAAERYITGMLLIGGMAMMVFSVDFAWTLAMAGTILAIFSAFTVFNPYINHTIALCNCIFYAIGISSIAIVRRATSVLAQTSFLMSLRDGYRSAALTCANHQLEMLATRDPLTGLANRRSAADQIGKIWGDRIIQKSSLAFVMADIDYFKKLNDTAGHAAGDDCLIRVARSIEASVRAGKDIVCRHGGEEFLIVLTGVTSDMAWMLAERIRDGVEALGIVNPGLVAVGGVPGVVTISVGVAFARDDEAAPELVIKSADDALYDAKRCGRNQVFMPVNGIVKSPPPSVETPSDKSFCAGRPQTQDS